MKNLFCFLWIIISYLIGSFPSGFIITKLSTRKNILEIGWRKTSGSNVFKNVGFWQGLLTGILDIAKGYFAVCFAKNLGFSSTIQALSGVAAVTGHNWSLFLRFAGGRGIGTFLGASLALSPEILKISLIPLLLFGIIWNLSIGTILFLGTAMVLSFLNEQLATMGLMTTLSLLPIFIKRLSPIEEIKKAEGKEKETLIKNRLIFDRDTVPPWRIVKIIKKLTKK
ncbi:glycerol-3-phosphate acyltransferase [bacterium]|nr:glycerol-3-phosphate acyltransferase [bacterium]